MCELAKKLASEEKLAEHLRTSNLTDALVKKLRPALQQLEITSTANADRLGQRESKFAGNANSLKFADLGTFFVGLEKQIGPPDPQVRLAMEREHTVSADSKDNFTPGNYLVTTKPEIEWAFVVKPGCWPDTVDPSGQHSWPDGWPADGWPKETKPWAEGEEHPREPMSMEELESRLTIKNGELRRLNESPLMIEEALAARL